MTPQLVDLNADGYQDMVMGTFEGTVFFVEGTREGFKPPQHILDKNNELVRISMYWDLKEQSYLFVDRSTAGENYIKDHHLTSSWAVDWDSDGDLDLLLGAYEGALYLCLNEGTSSSPLFSDKNLQVTADGRHLTLEGGLATPITCDWNGDGLFDILCGGSKGGVFYYQNRGEPGKPAFSAAVPLINDLANLDDPAGYMKMVPAIDGKPACPGSGFHINAVDYDGDSDLDLVVGGQSWFKAEPKALSADEQKELAGIQKQLEDLQTRMQAMMTGKMDSDSLKQVYESTEYKELSAELLPLYQASEELRPSPKAANHVWLFRNKEASSPGVSISSPPESEPGQESELATEPAFTTSPVGINRLNLTAEFKSAAAAAGDEVKLIVHISVPEGYHIYGAKNETAPTEFEMGQSGLLKAGEPAEVPAGTVTVDAGKAAYWLQGDIILEQTFSVPDGFDGETVAGQIKYMLCNEKGCQPPATKKFSATLKPL